MRRRPMRAHYPSIAVWREAAPSTTLRVVPLARLRQRDVGEQEGITDAAPAALDKAQSASRFRASSLAPKPSLSNRAPYSTVTDFARLRG